MKSSISLSEFIAIWEERWGKLDAEKLGIFLKNKQIREIIGHSKELVKSVTTKHKKVEKILFELEGISKRAKLNSIQKMDKAKKQKKYYENREIFEWLTRLNESKLDSESTFQVLEIESDEEICRSKRVYSNNKEAISALINLEKVKGNLIQQLPYKCKNCKKYHNSHLISRKTLNTLLELYQKPKKKEKSKRNGK